MERRVFVEDSPLGYRVILTRNRWREIIRYKHPALAGKEDWVRKCIREPVQIRKSEKDPEVHLHYVRKDREFLCVVVAEAKPGLRFVVTVYLTRKIKKGVELWKK